MQVCVSICWNRISACSFSEEHKCDASLTKQLLPRLHMLDSILCGSAVWYLIIKIRSLISTCSGLAVLACFLGNGSCFLWFWYWPWYQGGSIQNSDHNMNYRLHIRVPQPVTTQHAGTRSSSLSGGTNCHTQKVIHPLPDWRSWHKSVIYSVDDLALFFVFMLDDCVALTLLVLKCCQKSGSGWQSWFSSKPFEWAYFSFPSEIRRFFKNCSGTSSDVPFHQYVT